MTVTYGVLGVAAAFAVFALVHLTASLASAAMLAGLDAPRSRDAGRRARLAFFLGTLPTSLAGLAALLTSLAYLRHEPQHTSEATGLPLLALAAAGVLLMGRTVASVVAAWWRTRSFTRAWLARSHAQPVAGTIAEVGEHAHPLVSVVGILRPRLLLERRVLEVLTPEELSLVISHERAHLDEGDNLRQLLLAACADWPGIPCARQARARLARACELAADAAAAATPAAACTLASALVKLARLVPAEPLPESLASAFLRRSGVEERVAALTVAERSSGRPRGVRALLAAAWVTAAGAGLAMLPSLHAATESLVRLGR